MHQTTSFDFNLPVFLVLSKSDCYGCQVNAFLLHLPYTASHDTVTDVAGKSKVEPEIEKELHIIYRYKRHFLLVCLCQ